MVCLWCEKKVDQPRDCIIVDTVLIYEAIFIFMHLVTMVMHLPQHVSLGIFCCTSENEKRCVKHVLCWFLYEARRSDNDVTSCMHLSVVTLMASVLMMQDDITKTFQ